MIASQVVNSLAETSFKTNIMKRYIKSFAKCEDGTELNVKKIRKDNRYHAVLVRGGNAMEDGCSTV